MQNSAQENDYIKLEFNQLTTRELLQYVRNAYGLQVNGNEFGYITVSTWMRNKRVPLAYGGHKIVNIEKRDEFNMSVLTLEDFDRSILSAVKEIARPQIDIPKVSRPRKQRTALYYEILESKGKQTTKKTLKGSILPDNYLALGIKPNQLAGMHKDKRKQLTANRKS